MSVNPVDVTATYYAAWKAKDYDTLRSVLADDIEFTGPFGNASGADDLREKIEKAPGSFTDIVIRKVFSDGPDVVTWFEMHTSFAPPVQVAAWSHVVDGKIARHQAALDPRALLGLGQE
ncbi:nuclear transport factor 2 family protein [Streptomyces sp. SP17BM10]|uniref:nuclear transport factor 2 family protein n=1 Tax=Streptomyces sp. SP17BM10 TaxID=3002530 RepID=UPI002E79F621|nr:nuclear transport factor 2 family protein [Streptomyces sp. SP17BM10]MEE1782380.1 nuclear transport factor 2 family protein [Streptomyces sp. SP17BM10]